MTIPRLRSLLPVALVAVLLAACQGETTILTGESAAEAGITVSGTGEAAAAPDMAIIDVGVETTAGSVADAREAAAGAAARLIAAVKALGVEDRDVQTRAISVAPQYDFSRPGAPVIAGYTVSNVLTVRVRNLDRLSDVIDDGLAAAGNAARLNGLQFSFSDDAALLKTARERAIADARTRAETYAAAAGVAVGGVLAITESVSTGPVPLGIPRSAPATGGTSTPIEPGESTVSVTVTVRYAIAR